MPIARTRKKRLYVNRKLAQSLKLSRRTLAGVHPDLGQRSRWWVRANGVQVFRIERFAGGSQRFALAQVDGESIAIVDHFATLRDAFRAARRLYATRQAGTSASADCHA